MKQIAALAAVVAFALTGCATSTGPDRDDDAKSSSTPAGPKYDGAAYAKKVEKEMRVNLAGKIGSRCKMADLTWHCFFDHYESPFEGRINVYLEFPGDTSSSEAAAFAEQARLHTFNLAGYSLEDLAQVVSFNNGVDSGATNRADVPLLN